MSEMAALVARRETIEIAGIQITVHALSVRLIGELIARYSSLWAKIKAGEIIDAIGDVTAETMADIVVDGTRGQIPRDIALQIDPTIGLLIGVTIFDLTTARLREDPNLGNLAARHWAGLQAKMAEAQAKAQASSTSSQS